MKTFDHLADIVIPTHNHPLLLPLSIESALKQTAGDIRVIVIGDGVSDDTRLVMQNAMSGDSRIDFLDLPKAGRTGETHRHNVVTRSTAKFITYHSDDDLMAPDHVATMAGLLDSRDVVMPIGIQIRADGIIECHPWSLAEEPERSMALDAHLSLFSLSGLSHTTSAYQRLPFGWRDTPVGFYTDQYMILQFLEQPWCTFGLSDLPTIAHLADSLRRDMSPEERFVELANINDWLSDPPGWNEFRSQAFNYLRHNAAIHHRELVLTRERLEEVQKQLNLLTMTFDQLQAESIAQLSERVDFAESELQLLHATRTLKIRDFILRNKLLRFLIARR